MMKLLKYCETKPQQIGKGRSRYYLHTDNVMIVVFEFNDGPHNKPDPPHSHPHEQISYVATGKVAYFLNEEKMLLEAGDMIAIPPNVPHTIQLISKQARLVDAFHPIREDFLNE